MQKTSGCDLFCRPLNHNQRFRIGKTLLDKTIRQNELDGAGIEVYRSDKLLDCRDKMALALEFDLEQRVELIVVEVDNLALGATYTHGEADKVVEIELVALRLLNLEHKFVIENHLGTLLGVDIGKCHHSTALTTTSK